MVEGVHFLGPFFGRAYRVTRASDPPVSCAVLRSRDVFIFVTNTRNPQSMEL